MLRVLAISLVGGAVLYAADRCGPPAEFPDFERPLPANGRATLAVIQERLRQAPDDWTLNRLLVDSSIYHKQPVRGRIAQLAASHPASLDYQYLKARSLVGSNTKEALRIYAQILEKEPDYPWIHLSQLEIFRSEAFRNRSGLASSFSTLIRVCPGSLAPYRYLNDISDDAIAAKGAAKLRILLSDAKSPRYVSLYKILWAVEFRLQPKSQEEAEKKRIVLDLERLNPLDPDDAIRSTIRTGAKLVGDTALMRAMAITEPQTTAQDLLRLSNGWKKDHPLPKAEDSSEIKKTYGEALLKEARRWRDLDPESPIGYADTLRRWFL
jgi:hypothetical protein